MLICIGAPDFSALSEGQMVACVSDPFRHPERVKQAMDAKVTLMSMDMIPRRLSRAQAMDVNSSQDNLAGYKAVLMGAAQVPKGIPMMTTSAGTVRPAKFVIMGSGVAGLQAIATAKRLGAIVYASDVRKSTAEQIQSVGGRFIEVEGMDDFEDDSGYAKPLTPEFIQKVNDTVCEVAADADVVVTTARIFGRPAPITVPGFSRCKLQTRICCCRYERRCWRQLRIDLSGRNHHDRKWSDHRRDHQSSWSIGLYCKHAVFQQFDHLCGFSCQGWRNCH
ncbi:MAG: hypothetical protein Ct9H90mP16_02620 [Candidatus Poseidoniales archaeon]|nr:MAG: hypothetical protein Ct9H90mP16_02620 [Candidatus Poseidoniales archaeon]